MLVAPFLRPWENLDTDRQLVDAPAALLLVTPSSLFVAEGDAGISMDGLNDTRFLFLRFRRLSDEPLLALPPTPPLVDDGAPDESASFL